MSGPYDWADDPDYVGTNRRRRIYGAAIAAAAVAVVWLWAGGDTPHAAPTPPSADSQPVGIQNLTINVGATADVPPPVSIEDSAAIVRNEHATRQDPR
jgi:hypothetical protein